jgi:hypothetical protein
MQVADKDAARLLVELHNRQLFAGGLVLMGTLAFMSLLNHLGAVAIAARTQDIELARRQALRLAAPVSFLETVRATLMEFFPVPGLAPGAPSTSVKRPGAEGSRLDNAYYAKRVGGHAVGPASPAAVWHTVTPIGGDNGYYTMELLWWTRGVLDWLVGAPASRAAGATSPDCASATCTHRARAC